MRDVEWVLSHPAFLVTLAAGLAILGGEVGRRIARHARDDDEVRDTVRRVGRYMLPHFEAAPGKEAETLPARMARVEMLAQSASARGTQAVSVASANATRVEQIGAALDRHTVAEERLFADDAADRADRQEALDARLSEFSGELANVLEALTTGTVDLRRVD